MSSDIPLSNDRLVGVASGGILRIPFLSALLGLKFRPLARSSPVELSAVAGWGCRPTTRKPRAYSQKHGLPYLALEDGFLRSFGTGDKFPPLSLVLDEAGIYYDSTCPSSLENLLNSSTDVLAGIGEEVSRARRLILKHRLSKYNHAPLLEEGGLRSGDRARVLVVDQTAGDMSVALGAGSAECFGQMLEAARAENPEATVYVKTHPEVSAGRKRGHLSHVQDDACTVVLREAINPLSLIEHMDKVYVLSSTMGFEALLAGKAVTCFGLPWYAGWGATEDRQPCLRRTRRRTVDELFAAGYFHYSRYLDPVTHERGSIFDVIEWLVRQRRMAFGEAFPHSEGEFGADD